MQVSSKTFSWNKETKTFATCMSEARIRFEPVYPGLDTVGFTMISERTGRELKFILDHEIHAHEELQGWAFKALTRELDLTDIKAVVFND